MKERELFRWIPCITYCLRSSTVVTVEPRQEGGRRSLERPWKRSRSARETSAKTAEQSGEEERRKKNEEHEIVTRHSSSQSSQSHKSLTPLQATGTPQVRCPTHPTRTRLPVSGREEAKGETLETLETLETPFRS